MSSNHLSSAREFAILNSRNFISLRAAPIFGDPMLLMVWPRHRISRRQAQQEALFRSIKWRHERTQNETETYSHLLFTRGNTAFIINGVSCLCRLASDARRARKRPRAVFSESISFTSSFSLYSLFLCSIPVLCEWAKRRRAAAAAVWNKPISVYSKEGEAVEAGIRVRTRILVFENGAWDPSFQLRIRMLIPDPESDRLHSESTLRWNRCARWYSCFWNTMFVLAEAVRAVKSLLLTAWSSLRSDDDRRDIHNMRLRDVSFEGHTRVIRLSADFLIGLHCLHVCNCKDYHSRLFSTFMNPVDYFGYRRLVLQYNNKSQSFNYSSQIY